MAKTMNNVESTSDYFDVVNKGLDTLSFGEENNTISDGLLVKFKTEEMKDKVLQVEPKPSAQFDNEKWTKICKITHNVLLANIKQYNNDNNKISNSSMHPIILATDLKHNPEHTSKFETSVKLWDLNLLEFISLASSIGSSDFSFAFKLVDVPISPKSTEVSHKHKFVIHKLRHFCFRGAPQNKGPSSHTHGKFKLDSQTISPPKAQRSGSQDKPSIQERKGRVLEKFHVKGEVKAPANWDIKLKHDNSWDDPSNCKGGIFSLGDIKSDGKVSASSDGGSSTSALKNLSCLVQDFKVATKSNNTLVGNDDLNQIKMKDIDNFVFFDEDDDSLKSSQFSKFFKVFNDQKVQVR
ncbi:hypothetical protein BEWA_009550 [Theileria equi strain WA]|uniref:Uncharacterized protein n=1 Tax=Theileria equi strain WA TaxID=1537102 RepID=L0B2U1_THEEQ|nr:hypothetical protein BEWA_009550 [Theileria equi strain WA]AFZ81541.1 hypothetical protein BEWA_009550 [Theileria equi strain WA]|eukprot:XP_004831207.1 hypothetical protein BEWA_009550 [Theileria equi strain WA]